MADQVIVTVAEDRMGDIETFAQELRGAGLRVNQVLAPLGMISGSIPSAQRPALEVLPGVVAIEEQAAHQIAPPDSDVQ